MQTNPIFKRARFPLYLTERQLELLRETARERRSSITECVREAVHFWLKGKGKGDGLLFTHQETLDAIWETLMARGKGKGKGEQE